MNDRPTRKVNRLKGFDYSSTGDYHITICTKNRANLFWKNSYPELMSDAKNYTELLSDTGHVAFSVITRTENIYHNMVRIEKFVIMPDHIHMIISIYQKNLTNIGRIVTQIKRCISSECNMKNIWQKNYNDHIIRNKSDYNETWDYIDANPKKIAKNIFLK